MKATARAGTFGYDGSLPGFGLRVYPSGSKSFILRYRTATGRTRTMTLGKYGVLTLDQAPTKARGELVEVNDGADPMAEHKAASKAETMKAFGTLYLDRHAKPHRRNWPEDKRRLKNRIVPALGHLALKDVKRSDLAALHAEIGTDAPVEANRVSSLVSAMVHEGRSNGATSPKGPRTRRRYLGHGGIKRFKEQSRTRFVTPAEMPKLLENMTRSRTSTFAPR